MAGVPRRIVGGRPPIPTVLIVCEGEKTEPQYFQAFKLSSVKVIGTGKNTKSLVEEAIRLKNGSEGYDQYWCVFDRDSFPAQNFNVALSKATNAGFQVAYSNEAFEIWYLLHFNYSDAALARSLYPKKLTECLKRPYRKNDPTIFESLLEHQPRAIKNASKLLSTYDPHNPEKDNPCTTVHLLVEELNMIKRAMETPSSTQQ